MHDTTDLPVCVDLPGRLGQEVTAFVEAELGWQVVGAHGPLLPVVTLAAAPVSGRPTIVVTPSPVAPSAVREALLGGAGDVIGWPEERARLAHAALRDGGASPALPPAPVLRLAGTRGGVGTSTVALAVAGTVAWSGGRSLVVGGDALLRLAGRAAWSGPGSVELAALGRQAVEEVARLAVAVEAVPGMAVLGGGGVVADTGGWPYDLVVVDAGVGDGAADVVVAAADAALGAAPPLVPVLVVEHGPLDRAAVKGVLGRDPIGWLPYSARVARAGSSGRFPSGLPGSWIAVLRKALAAA